MFLQIDSHRSIHRADLDIDYDATMPSLSMAYHLPINNEGLLQKWYYILPNINASLPWAPIKYANTARYVMCWYTVVSPSATLAQLCCHRIRKKQCYYVGNSMPILKLIHIDHYVELI